MENSYMTLIQEKDDKINILEEQMNKLNSKSSVNTKELTKENIKLKYELKKLKEENNNNQNYKLKSSNLNDYQDYSNNNLTNLYKNFQENVKTFKENLKSLNQEKENLYKKNFMEKFKEEIKWKTKNLGEEIISSIDHKIENLTQNYENEINRYKNEINDLKNQNKSLEENYKENQNYKIKYEQIKKQFQDIMNISKNKDTIIETQKKTLKTKDEQINELNGQKDNFQLHLSEYITKYNEKNVEIEEIFATFEAVLSKKKKDYEIHFNNLSEEIQNKFVDISKHHKFKLS
jgi:chromosome segregation ATPase